MIEVFANDIGNSPATVNRYTGVIKKNAKTWNTFSQPLQKIIIGHETGHYKMQTTDEIEADGYAFDMYKGPNDGVTLQDLYNSVASILTFKNKEDYKRLNAQKKRIQNYLKQNPNLMYETSNISGYLGSSDSSFLGLGKKAQARKDTIANARAEAKVIRATNSGSGQGTGDTILNTIGNIATGLLGGSAASAATPSDPNAAPVPQSDNTMYIVGGIVLILVVAAIFYFTKKKA